MQRAAELQMSDDLRKKIIETDFVLACRKSGIKWS